MRPAKKIFPGLAAAVLVLFSIPARAQTSAQAQQAFAVPRSTTYTNPLSLNDPKTGPAVSCPDPAIIKRNHDGYIVWYLYCTGDPLNSNDKDANGNLKNHLISSFRSVDLIHWTYIGDVLQSLPAWMGNVSTNLWAPAVKYFNNQYYLYYVAPVTAQGGSAIGVATSKSPAGPWTDSGKPVVAPEPNPYSNSFLRAVIDPDEVQDASGQRYISYGSYNGGVSIRKLSADGLTSDPSSEQQIAIDNRFEGAAFWQRDNYYYLFVSTTNCCNGPLTGYSVLVGRSLSPTGPFLDKNGIPLNTFAPGGSFYYSGASETGSWPSPNHRRHWAVYGGLYVPARTGTGDAPLDALTSILAKDGVGPGILTSIPIQVKDAERAHLRLNVSGQLPGFCRGGDSRCAHGQAHPELRQDDCEDVSTDAPPRL